MAFTSSLTSLRRVIVHDVGRVHCNSADSRQHPVLPVNQLRSKLASRKPADHTSLRWKPTQTRVIVCQASEEATAPPPMVAVEGDLVEVHFKVFGEDGEILGNSREEEDPTTFEVGAGEVMGNPLFRAFDEAVRGLALGDKVNLKASGGDWKQELLFSVPPDHAEVVRLQNRYKNIGGLSEGLVVELANGGRAMVVKMDDTSVVLDANNMLAGKTMTIELELVAIERSGADQVVQA